MICPIVEHGNLAGICRLNNEARISRCERESPSVEFEETARLDEPVQTLEKVGLGFDKFGHNSGNLCAVKALGHELYRVSVKRKDNLMPIFKNSGIVCL